jgi:hypothetical protein
MLMAKPGHNPSQGLLRDDLSYQRLRKRVQKGLGECARACLVDWFLYVSYACASVSSQLGGPAA